MDSSTLNDQIPLKKPKIEQPSTSSEESPPAAPAALFDASKVAQLIQKIADRLENNNQNSKNNVENCSTTSIKKENFAAEEIDEAKNRPIENLNLDEAKRYVRILRHLLQIKDVELRMAEMEKFDSKKEIESVNQKLQIITKKMENFKSMLTTPKLENQKQKSPNNNDHQQQSPRHKDPLDVTCPEILSKFLDRTGNFDEIAYELVVNAYEKFYLEFERDFKNLDDESLEQRKKSMRRFTSAQYWSWRKENFSLERCQQFLITLITFQFFNTTNLNRLAKNSLAAEICQLENSARKAAYLMLEHSDVAVVDYGRDMSNLWAGRDVQAKARHIAANSARGLWAQGRK